MPVRRWFRDAASPLLNQLCAVGWLRSASRSDTRLETSVVRR
jgi:hypothetical protein